MPSIHISKQEIITLRIYHPSSFSQALSFKSEDYQPIGEDGFDVVFANDDDAKYLVNLKNRIRESEQCVEQSK